MLEIDLNGKRAFVAGVADDGGFGFAIAKALAEGMAIGGVDFLFRKIDRRFYKHTTLHQCLDDGMNPPGKLPFQRT